MRATAESIANEIRLSRTQLLGPFLIVEGPADSRTYRRALNPLNVTLVGFGHENVRQAISLVEQDGLRDTVGIVDADFASLRGGAIDQANLLNTDSHDLEVMFLKSPALDKVVDALGSRGKVRDFEETTGETIRESLFRRALPMGLLRWISERDELRLRFDGLSARDYLNRRTLEPDIDALVRAVINRSPSSQLRASDLRTRYEAIASFPYDLDQTCCGPDVVSVLALGLTAALGSRKALEASVESVTTALELSYEADWFLSTNLYARLRAWQASNGLPICL